MIKREEVVVPFPSQDEHTIRALLESLVEGGAYAHFYTARILEREWQKTTNINRKIILATEIFCKYMQTVEDFGAFCLMWLSQGSPLQTCFETGTKQIVKFYGRCRSGLPFEEIKKILGLMSTEDLIR